VPSLCLQQGRPAVWRAVMLVAVRQCASSPTVQPLIADRCTHFCLPRVFARSRCGGLRFRQGGRLQLHHSAHGAAAMPPIRVGAHMAS
jgi:hypothetical protein